MNSTAIYPDEILVVDDTPASLKLLDDILSNAGYLVRLATDGELALRSAKIQPPALVLLDIRMPGLDGYEVCQHLKDDEKTRSLPIIFLSILEDEQEKVKAFQVGAVDYLNKPIRPAELLARVHTHLSLRHAQLDLESRNTELEEMRNTLDEKVKERSAELEQVNQSLQSQIDMNLHALETLKESEERFRRLTENARDVIYRMSLPDGKYEYVSPAAISVFGYTPEEFYATRGLLKKVLHPDWHTYFEEQWEHLIKDEMPPTYEYQIIHKSGEVRWLNQRNILVCDDAGNSIAIEGIVTDITERKHAEDELRKLNEGLEQRVMERTKELEKKNMELEKMNKLFVGRELSMIELKKKIAMLEKNN